MPDRIQTGALAGIDGLLVTAEVDISRGLPGFHLVGLPNTEVRESRDRVLAALRNSAVRIPPGRITVNLAPAGVRKEGASFDVAIALGVVAAGESRSGRSPRRRDLSETLFVGELSLFGELRPVRGLLAIVMAAAQRGVKRVVVPARQVREAKLVDSLEVQGAEHLSEVLSWWRGGRLPAIDEAVDTDEGDQDAGSEMPAGALDGLGGQSLVRKAAVLAAVGGHHLLMVGPPGTGKTRLARILGSLQPPLGPGRALEVTRIHSAVANASGSTLMHRPPLRAPHHTITRAALIGSGAPPRPGEVTLAHGGMLFLDELAEFSPSVLDALREPLEDGRVLLARGGSRFEFPARFQLIAAMNPCRCGYLGSGTRPCRCSAGERSRYLSRLSGPLLDRFDLFVEVGAWRGAFTARKRTAATDRWRDGAFAVASRARETLAVWRGRGLSRLVTRGGAAALDEAREALGLSLRGVQRCLSVAATLAALDDADAVDRAQVTEALEFRRESLLGDVEPV